VNSQADIDMPVQPADLLAALGQAVIATDLDGVIFYWNPAAEHLYGWSADEARGSNIACLTVPETSQEFAKDIMAALRAGIPWSGGFSVRRKDGTIFPALVTDSGIYRDGTLVGIVGVSSNLGNALRPLLERSTDAALVLAPDGVITYATPAHDQLFGWKHEALIGKSIVPMVHPEDRAALAEYLKHAVSRPGPHPPLDLRIRREKAWTWAEAALTNLLDDPVVRGVVCNLRLSAGRAAQEQAEQRAKHLETALSSRTVIEQAKGLLAERRRISPDTAFDLLRRYARSHNVTIRDVSRRLLDGNLLLDSESPHPDRSTRPPR